MQILGRIDWGVMNPDLVVQVRARAVPGRAHVAQDVATADVLTCNHSKARKMGIQGLYSVSMVDDYFAAITGAQTGLNDGTVRRRPDCIAPAGRDIDPSMKCSFPIERIEA